MSHPIILFYDMCSINSMHLSLLVSCVVCDYESITTTHSPHSSFSYASLSFGSDMDSSSSSPSPAVAGPAGGADDGF